MTPIEALFVAARALRETTARQVFGSPGDKDLGTACAGSTIWRVSETWELVNKTLLKTQCPKCEMWGALGGWPIVHLNDAHRMSFSAIAEYLETLAVERMGKGVDA